MMTRLYSAVSLLSIIIFHVQYYHQSYSQSQVCSSDGVKAGIPAVSRQTFSNSTLQDEHFLLIDKGTINCAGVIQEWIFHGNTTCDQLQFEVWRITTPQQYEFVGKNVINAADCSNSTGQLRSVRISAIYRIPVLPGYIIGWHHPAGGISSGTSSLRNISTPGVYAVSNTSCSSSPGTTCTFTNATIPTDFSVQVTVTQGEPPVISNLPANISVKENVASGNVFRVFFYHVNELIRVNSIVPINITISPQSAIFSVTNPPNNNQWADIVLNSALDFEQQSEIILSITASVLGQSDTQNLTVTITDVNEPHSISNLPDSLSVSAALSTTTTLIFRTVVSDPDNFRFQQIKYYIADWFSPHTATDTPPFTLHQDTGEIYCTMNLTQWSIQQSHGTSYPTFVLYVLNLMATDGMYDAQSQLNITIVNILQPPVITNLPATVDITENAPTNIVIYQIQATNTYDVNMVFQIISCDPLSDNFCIDQNSGIIRLCSNAKIQPNINYTVTVVAASSSLTSSAQNLSVYITLVNTAPVFSQEVYFASFPEKCGQEFQSCDSYLPLGWQVPGLTLSVYDREVQQYGDTVTCYIEPGFGSNMFKSPLVNCSVLHVTSVIDLDANPQYEHIALVIRADDSQNVMTYTTINITVTNINDHWPIFNSSQYAATINENVVGGTSVITVFAVDNDAGRNGQITFTIQPSSVNFEVDKVSGVISNKQPLDYEQGYHYEVVVIASDESSPIKTSSARVNITVTDINDNRPIFNCSDRPADEPYQSAECFYNLDLSPYTTVGSHLTHITAYDIDSNKVNITYELLEAIEGFTLNNVSGNITVSGALQPDYNYLLVCYATDNSNPSLHSNILYVRADAYIPQQHLVDITLDINAITFDAHYFITCLRSVTTPWLAKMSDQKEINGGEGLTVTVYILSDSSTYKVENIGFKKQFVHRDEMLSTFRINIYGDPSYVLTNAPMDQFHVVTVQPTYPVWWTDTVEGIATIIVLSTVAFVSIVLIATALCKQYNVACFKPKEPAKELHTWQQDQQQLTETMT